MLINIYLFHKIAPKENEEYSLSIVGTKFLVLYQFIIIFGNVQIVLALFSFDFVILNSYSPPKIPIFQETIHITIYFVLRVTIFDNYSRCRPDEGKAKLHMGN